MEIHPSTNKLLPSQELSIIPFDNNNLPGSSTSTDEEAGGSSYQVDSTPFGQNLVSYIIHEYQENCTSEQLLTTIFTWVMGAVSLFHLVLGLELLEKTGLSRSFSPVVMSSFKYSLAIVASHSVISGEVNFSAFKIFVLRKSRYSCIQGLVLPLAQLLATIAEQHRKIICYITDISFMVCLGGFNGHGKHGWLIKFVLYKLLQAIMFPVHARIHSSSELLLVIQIINSFFRAASSDLQLLTSSAPSLLCFLDKGIKKLLPVAMARVNNFLEMLKEKKIAKLIRYAIGLVGKVIFQNFFHLTAFNETKAFLYLATSWLAILTMINASEDFGILNFLLGNTILGSTVSQSGLKSTTWFTCGLCLLLYVLRLNFKSASSPNLEMMQRPPYLFWIFYLCITFESLYCLVHQI